MARQKLFSLTAALGVAGVAAVACAQDAVQWRVELGGNGHWYAIRNDGGTWSQARLSSELAGGHLATITDAQENAFLWGLLGASTFYPCFAFLGGHQDTAAAGYVEPAGGWRWVTGEPFSYTAWFPGEPNDGFGCGGCENYLSFRQFDCNARWNDTGDNSAPNHTYAIEWSADCNGDGIVDFGQIRAGEFGDANANNIPDCCESASECPDSTPAVQWSTQSGGNGHWYSLRVDPLVPIEQFNSRCEAIGGHLASITGPSEHVFVLQLMSTQGWLGIAGWPAIGLQRSSDSAPWQWVTGEATAYLPWAPGEPSSGGRFAQLWGVGQTPNLTWSANGNSFMSVAVIEWSADCNGDGVVDFGQIRAGELDDANANNIPDCCETGEPCGCEADLDGNGTVNGIDLAVVLNKWGTDGGKDYPQADIDGSGTIDAADLAALLNAWGACP